MNVPSFSRSSGEMSMKSIPFPTWGYFVTTTALVTIVSALQKKMRFSVVPISNVNLVSM